MNYDCAFADGIKLRVVRAFLTNEEVRKNYGIFADFSVKLIGQMSVKGRKPEEIELASINGLTLSTTRDGKAFIGSIGKDSGLKGGKIYSFQIFPIGFDAHEDKKDEQTQRQQDLIARLTKTVTEAAHGFAQRAVEQRSQPVKMPDAYASMPARKSNKSEEDIPL